MKRIVIVWVMCVLAGVGLMGWLGTGMLSPAGRQSAQPSLISGDFSLFDGSNMPRTSREMRGRYQLVFFGYTHCPDVCPTTLLLVQNTLNNLGKTAEKIQPIFITVDPERDTPAVMGEYVKHFGDRILGLSGSPEQIAHAADSFKVFYSKVEDKESALDYVMDHSGFLYLMGPDGKYVTHFPSTIAQQALEEGLRTHVR